MKRNTGLYHFLNSGGYLTQGPERIAEGKKAYRRQYLRHYKANYREKTVEHTIACKPVDEKAFADAAKRHGMKTPEYIRLAALAYSNKVFLIPRLDAIYQVQQNIIYTRTQIERVRQEKKSLFAKSKDEEIEMLLQSLEQTIQTAFKQPDDLESLIAEALRKHAGFAERLQIILLEYAGKEHGAKE